MNDPEPRMSYEWPGTDDLSIVLKRIMDWRYSTRKTREGRVKLANNEMTRELLEAGMRLVTDQFKPGQPPNQDEPIDDASPFFEWLSIARVTAEVANGSKGLQATDEIFRDRWPHRAGYIEDLLACSLWARHWSLHISMAAESKELLTTGSDFVQAIHQIAYNDLRVVLDSPAYRISLIAAAMADRNPTIHDVMGDTYKLVTETWASLYQATLEARGLRLRPGISLTELTDMLTALAEGIGLRLITDPNAGLIDHERQQSLLGKAALALAVGCFDTGDGLSLEELVGLMAGQEGTRDSQGS